MDQCVIFIQNAFSFIKRFQYIVIHDGFQPLATWEDFLQGSDRVILDEHNYFSFGGLQLDPIGVNGSQTGIPGGKWPLTVCNNWGASTNNRSVTQFNRSFSLPYNYLSFSRKNFGVTIGGEFAGSPNDCGLFLRGVNITSDNPECPEYDAWESYNSTMKAGIQNFIMASFDALGDWFFWTWKVSSLPVTPVFLRGL